MGTIVSYEQRLRGAWAPYLDMVMRRRFLRQFAGRDDLRSLLVTEAK